MEKAKEYTVVRGTMEELVSEVNELIKKGWIPVGGINYDSGVGSGIYIQAMVKFEGN